MIIYKQTNKNEPLDKTPKTVKETLIDIVAFIGVTVIGALMGAWMCFLFSFGITLISGYGVEGFILIFNNNVTYFSSFGAFLVALMIILD